MYMYMLMQVMQLFEANLLYRNHILTFNSLDVDNHVHKSYGNRACFGEREGLVITASVLRASLGQHIRHCSIHNFRNSTLNILPPKSDFAQGMCNVM